MNWIEISFDVRSDGLSRVEQALEDLGAVSVTLLDAEDHPILEPGVGETPVWPMTTVRALFDQQTDQRGLFGALQIMIPWLTPQRLTIAEVPDQEWTRVWMDQFKPMSFGQRLWVYPSDHEAPADPDRVVVRLDPGLAFGSGTHQTTALCLRWLDQADLAGKRVLDFGCGSGILAIAALKLGAASAVAIDNDPQALIASAENAARNDCVERLQVFMPDAAPSASYPIVLANILAKSLIELCAGITAATEPGGTIVLSGILHDQADDVIAAYTADFEQFEVARDEDWVRITARRHVHAMP
ncbi:50S ribosomal protein L11 methyltransferase [Ahniella affigens]|uniref:Ribosomal protein L11 methyltransferase n=1 Tax=Ahniella affigens TaxID=2021234 RepID=A0A2P1PZ76_9GAMM|nr:50S ribosomal protein L11 methyltransferase [Ahniella affigens]AVQ00136.1 50S ribosomal protein L11 methyltransferase [Ahniella affigens]